MSDREKDVMVYHYDPRRRIFLVSLHLENRPGALGNLADLLGVRGMNILEGYFGGISSGPKGVLSFFVETTNRMMDANWLKDFIETSVFVSDVVVKPSVEGFIVDSLNFPLTWNTGDRAVMMRIAGVRAVLDAAKSGPDGERLVYEQGFNYGKAAWLDMMSVYRPNTREGWAEELRIYVATGWGQIDLLELDFRARWAKVRMREGFECAGLRTGRPESNFIRGHLAGAFSAYFGTDVGAFETKCSSMGHPYCEYEIRP
jgi:predicted hydrocarbon binding protein